MTVGGIKIPFVCSMKQSGINLNRVINPGVGLKSTVGPDIFNHLVITTVGVLV